KKIRSQKLAEKSPNSSGRRMRLFAGVRGEDVDAIENRNDRIATRFDVRASVLLLPVHKNDGKDYFPNHQPGFFRWPWHLQLNSARRIRIAARVLRRVSSGCPFRA